jgi:hypothetical protein
MKSRLVRKIDCPLLVEQDGPSHHWFAAAVALPNEESFCNRLEGRVSDHLTILFVLDALALAG